MLEIKPIHLKPAREFVRKYHRHNRRNNKVYCSEKCRWEANQTADCQGNG